VQYFSLFEAHNGLSGWDPAGAGEVVGPVQDRSPASPCQYIFLADIFWGDISAFAVCGLFH